VGEFLVLLGTFGANNAWARSAMEGFFPNPKLMAIIAASAVILSAMYLLTMTQKIFFGPLDKPENRDPHLRDIHGRERWVFGFVIVAALGLGIYPKPILDRSEQSVASLITNFQARLKDARLNPTATAHLFPANNP
jgi:NADH-quinone oxidoreductase subunit M